MALFGGGMPPGIPGAPGPGGPGPVPMPGEGGTEVAECGAINCINNANGSCRLGEITVSRDGRCADFEPGGAPPERGGPARPMSPPPPAAPRLGM